MLIVPMPHNFALTIAKHSVVFYEIGILRLNPGRLTDVRCVMSNSELAITLPYPSSATSPSLFGVGSSQAPTLFSRPRQDLWQTLSLAMHELPHGFPLVQCGPLVSLLPLRQVLMNCFRASPVMPLACVVQSFIRCWDDVRRLPRRLQSADLQKHADQWSDQ
jgi:hypothetical protein